MLRVRLGFQDYAVGFEYQTEKRTAIARVYRVLGANTFDGKPVYSLVTEATARANSTCDQFNRTAGRKLALRRALDAAQFSRQQRRDVWEQLFARNMRRAYKSPQTNRKHEHAFRMALEGIKRITKALPAAAWTPEMKAIADLTHKTLRKAGV